MPYQLKKLDDSNLSKVKDLEKDLGACVVAFEYQPPAAQVSEPDLKKLQELEKQMKAVLVAYKC